MAQAKRKTPPKRSTTRRRSSTSKLKARPLAVAAELPSHVEGVLKEAKLSPLAQAQRDATSTLNRLEDIVDDLALRLAPVLTPTEGVDGQAITIDATVAPAVQAVQTVEARARAVAIQIEDLLAHLAI